MKTKEKILEEHCLGNGQFMDESRIDGYTENVYSAMDEYAKQQSIAFQEWADTCAVRNGFHEWTVGCGNAKKKYTSDELYSLFLENQTK